MQKKKNDLDILLPESEFILRGETIEIKPFPFRKLPKVIDLLSKMGAGIYSLLAGDGLNFNANGNVVINQSFLENIGRVAEEHFPEIVELMAIYTDKPVTFYTDEGVNAEDGLMLLVGIIERNYDFFTKRLAPEMAKINAKKTK
ncbi:MAG TPA: hypothetical protein PKA10_18345 [Selenomonadales bacterium]|nr:hypothetical protein [Selenomonadales bacterium]